MNAKDIYTPFQQKLYEALFEARTSTNDLEVLVERYTLPLYGIILREVEIRLTALEDKVEEMQQKKACTCSGHIHDLTDAIHKEGGEK